MIGRCVCYKVDAAWDLDPVLAGLKEKGSDVVCAMQEGGLGRDVSEGRPNADGPQFFWLCGILVECKEVIAG